LVIDVPAASKLAIIAHSRIGAGHLNDPVRRVRLSALTSVGNHATWKDLGSFRKRRHRVRIIHDYGRHWSRNLVSFQFGGTRSRIIHKVNTFSETAD